MQNQSNVLGDASQELEAELQNAEQDYQVAVSTVSEIMQETSDTSTSTIKNLK